MEDLHRLCVPWSDAAASVRRAGTLHHRIASSEAGKSPAVEYAAPNTPAGQLWDVTWCRHSPAMTTDKPRMLTARKPKPVRPPGAPCP